MNPLRLHSTNSDQRVEENERTAAEQPTTAQPVTAEPVTVQSTVVESATVDDMTVPAADYDDDEDDQQPGYDDRPPVAVMADDGDDLAADYDRADYNRADYNRGDYAAPTPVPAPRAANEAQPVPQAQPVAARAVAQPTAPPAMDGPLLGDVDATELRTRWQQVQADFVDDPRTAVGGAAELVEQTAQAMVDALQQRQRQMRGLWDQDRADATGTVDGGGDTEQLRQAMQRYRTLFNALCER